MCWWEITIRAGASRECPRPSTAWVRASSDVPELGPASTSVSGSSSIR